MDPVEDYIQQIRDRMEAAKPKNKEGNGRLYRWAEPPTDGQVLIFYADGALCAWVQENPMLICNPTAYADLFINAWHDLDYLLRQLDEAQKRLSYWAALVDQLQDKVGELRIDPRAARTYAERREVE